MPELCRSFATSKLTGENCKSMCEFYFLFFLPQQAPVLLLTQYVNCGFPPSTMLVARLLQSVVTKYNLYLSFQEMFAIIIADLQILASAKTRNSKLPLLLSQMLHAS